MKLDSSLLAGTKLFQGLTEEARRRLVDVAVRMPLRRDEELFQQDDEANRLVLLCEGHVKVTRLDAEGRRIVVRIAQRGETVGCVATLSHARYPATATVAAPGSALAWSRPEIDQLTATIPRLALNALQMQSVYVRELIDRLHELSTPKLERRIALTLERLLERAQEHDPGVERIPYALTRQELAELTGTTIFSVSRVLSEWDRRGVVRSERAAVTVLNREELRRIGTAAN